MFLRPIPPHETLPELSCFLPNLILQHTLFAFFLLPSHPCTSTFVGLVSLNGDDHSVSGSSTINWWPSSGRSLRTNDRSPLVMHGRVDSAMSFSVPAVIVRIRGKYRQKNMDRETETETGKSENFPPNGLIKCFNRKRIQLTQIKLIIVTRLLTF